MIFYFSSTGNCKYVAERIAKQVGDKACSIVDFKKEQGLFYQLKDYECLGIVTPTYAWELPSIMEEFLEKIEFKMAKDNYVFCVSTYGTMPGASGACVKHILEEKNVKVDALYSVIMPDNWTPFFDLSNPDQVSKTLEKSEKQLKVVLNRVTKKSIGSYMNRSLPYAVSKITNNVYQKMRKTSHFHVEESCIGCGLCEKKCPVNSIQMKYGKPQWVTDQCVMCLGCLHHCPKFAIQYGNKTKSHGQYQNPHTY